MSYSTAASTRSSTASLTLLKFYSPTSPGPDSRGRYLEDILTWDVDHLESSHDYIQILFPLPEESGVNWNAPVVNREIFEAFRSGDEEGKGLRLNLRRAFEKLAWFYGFDVEGPGEAGGEVKVTRSTIFARYQQNWNTRFDHNHLRITRIIRSLRVLGLENEALAFYHALENVESIRVSDKSREFWRRAAERALNVRPDVEIRDENDENVGLKFLKEFETERRRAAMVSEGKIEAAGASSKDESSLS